MPPRCVAGQEELLPIPRAAGCQAAGDPKSLPPFLTGLDPARCTAAVRAAATGRHWWLLLEIWGREMPGPDLGPMRWCGERACGMRCAAPWGGSTWGLGVSGGGLVAMPAPGGLWAGSPQAGCWHQVPGGREPSLGWQRSCRSHPKPPRDLAKAESILGAQISPDPFSPLSRDPSAVPSPLPCCSPAPSSLPTTEMPRSRAQHPASPPRGGGGGFSGPCYNQCIGCGGDAPHCRPGERRRMLWHGGRDASGRKRL